MARKTREEKNLAFLDYVAKSFTRETFATVFLPIFEESHSQLAAELRKELDSRDFTSPPIKQCSSCIVKSKIKMRKFASILHERDLITESLHLNLSSRDITESAKWNELTNHVKKKSNHLMEALHFYNPCLFNMLKRAKQTLLVCICDELSTVVQRSTVTETGENADGEADVARMSDFSSEVSSPVSQILSDMETDSAGSAFKRNFSPIPSPSHVRINEPSVKMKVNPAPTIAMDTLLDSCFRQTGGQYVRSEGVIFHEDGHVKSPPDKYHKFTPPKPVFTSQRLDEERSPAARDRRCFCVTVTKDVLDMETVLTRKRREVKILKHKLALLKRKSIKGSICKFRNQRHRYSVLRKFIEKKI